MHTITKSQVVGKALKDLPKDVSAKVQNIDRHAKWTKLSTGAIDFLSRCTLRYTSNYGATYKIDPTHALRITSNKNRHFYLDSYEKLLELVIEDYQELKPQEHPMSDSSTPKYLDRKPKAGDYTERVEAAIACMPIGFISKVINHHNDIRFLDQRGEPRDLFAYRFKVINPDHPSHPEYKEQPIPTSQDVKVGTHWERINYYSINSPDGEIVTIEKVYGDAVYFNKSRNRGIKDFLDSFKPRPDLDTPTDKRNLAFYKESGESWTEEELDTVRNYYGDTSNRFRMPSSTTKRKYAYWHDGPNEVKVYLWDDQTKPKQLEQVSYESVFTVAIPTKKHTTEPKSKPVAQPEPIQSITKETFMSKIKDTALTTVGQNKQALVIASKMEAGRIINKQVLKQLKPHLPFFLQGYASSPFAPFVAANLVAMVANHTQNSKLLKVSDLMLLGAVDSGVTSFNLNDIVEDILSKIKLPAGVLDDSDDE